MIVRLPKDERDLAAAVGAQWVCAYDNVGDIPEWLSDAFCTVATGGAFLSRRLYTDADPFVIAAARPLLLNGLGSQLSRADFGSRAVRVEFLPIVKSQRKIEDEMLEEFRRAHPWILGGLLDVVVAVLQNLATVKTVGAPRMAGPAKWLAAAEERLSRKPGTFSRVMVDNQKSVRRTSASESVVAVAVSQFVEIVIPVGGKAKSWAGTPSDVWHGVGEAYRSGTVGIASWPRSAARFSYVLNSLVATLAEVGIVVRFKTVHGQRFIEFSRRASRKRNIDNGSGSEQARLRLVRDRP
jgi:hypothetical protein